MSSQKFENIKKASNNINPVKGGGISIKSSSPSPSNTDVAAIPRKRISIVAPISKNQKKPLNSVRNKPITSKPSPLNSDAINQKPKILQTGSPDNYI